MSLLIEEKYGHRWQVVSNPTLSMRLGETNTKFVMGTPCALVVEANFVAERAGPPDVQVDLHLATFAEQVKGGQQKVWLPAAGFSSLRCDDATIEVTENAGVQLVALTLSGAPADAGAQHVWRCDGGAAVALRVW